MGKIKISELAQQLGIDPAEIIESAKKLGESPKTASAALDESTAAKIRASFLLRRPGPQQTEQKQAVQAPVASRQSLFDVDKKKAPNVKAATAEAVEAAKAAEAALLAAKEGANVEKAAKPELKKSLTEKQPTTEAKKVVKKKDLPESILKTKAPAAKPPKVEEPPAKEAPVKEPEKKRPVPKHEPEEPLVVIIHPTEEKPKAKGEAKLEHKPVAKPEKKPYEPHAPGPKVEGKPERREVPPLREDRREPPAARPKPTKDEPRTIFDRPVAKPVVAKVDHFAGLVMREQKPPIKTERPREFGDRRPAPPPRRVDPSRVPPPPPAVPDRREREKDKDKEKREEVSSAPYIVGKDQFLFKRKTHKPQSKQPRVAVAPKPIEVKPQKLTIEVFAKTAGVPEQRVMTYMLKQGLIPNPDEELTGEVLELLSNAFGLKTSAEGKLSNENLMPRSPIVTVMGHVDHGKTTLLDYIRKTQVAAGEAGGITQSIGAYKVKVGNRDIVFIDTPGHEAFATMRREGANVTDIVILVVAADEGVKEQTIEAVNMAKEAKVAVVVAANKMDRPGVNLDKLKAQLSDLGLAPEEWGGDTMVVPIVAKTGDGVPALLEMILLQADILELKMNKAGKLAGTIIESRMDRFVGPLATAIVQSGTLKVGDYLEAGMAWGRVKALYDHLDQKVQKVSAVSPVKIMGFDSVPKPGSIMLSSDVSRRRKTEKPVVGTTSELPTVSSEAPSDLDSLFKVFDLQGATKLNVVVKADSEGSLDAVKFALSKIKIKDIPANIVYSGIGIISENDVLLAEASKATLVGFNVQVDPNARKTAKQKSVGIATYNIIFELTDAVTDAIKNLIEPEFRDVKVGQAEVRQVFNISDVGNIAGCFVTDGYVNTKVKVKVVRNRLPVYETKISSLKRFKEDANEVKAGYECGIGLEGFNDMKAGDTLEFYLSQEVPQS